MINEEIVKDYLTKWLNTFKVNVWWEKKNCWNYPVFKCSTKTKPDFLIEMNRSYFAIEVKNSIIGDMNIIDALVQIKRYANSNSKFYVNNNEVIPNGYLVATQNSIHGYFYDNDVIRPVSEGRKFAIRNGQIPAREYEKSSKDIRLLWRLAKEDKIKSPVGGLLSNELNNDHSIAPLLFYNKGKHGQMFEVWS